MSDTFLDLRDRGATFSALAGRRYDILVIGAGITGCGVARDAALRGLSVALVDAGDIGSGTSSRSSKLIHGGLRYLAQGDLGVVREAATERRILRKIAPHLSVTNPMVILARSVASMMKLRAALWSYEKLGHVDRSEHYEVWDAERLHEREPHIVRGPYAGALVYPEYLTDDARLTLANARSAAGAGAVVGTYATVVEILREDGRAAGAVVRSTLPDDRIEASIRARVVVNAAGPWVDEVRHLEAADVSSRLTLTKGIHIVVNRDRLPIFHTIVMSAPDKRGVFAVPREGFVYIGTTDTFYPNAEHWPRITREDIEYLLDPVGETFDIEPLRHADIVALWSGLRPLIGEKGKKPSEISRKNEIMEGPGGMLTIAGGKLTSYRSMAERVVDLCEEKMGGFPQPSSTARSHLPGGDFTEPFEELVSRVEALGLSHWDAERAARLYGSEALSVYAKERGPAAEAEQAVLREGALTLEDYWVRRSARFGFDREGGMEALEEASSRMAELLGWSEEKREDQVGMCRERRQAEMRILTDNGGRF